MREEREGGREMILGMGRRPKRKEKKGIKLKGIKLTTLNWCGLALMCNPAIKLIC